MGTTVHDCQIVSNEDIPVDKLLEHDVPVDLIVTPTQVMFKIRPHGRGHFHPLSEDRAVGCCKGAGGVFVLSPNQNSHPKQTVELFLLGFFAQVCPSPSLSLPLLGIVSVIHNFCGIVIEAL